MSSKDAIRATTGEVVSLARADGLSRDQKLANGAEKRFGSKIYNTEGVAVSDTPLDRFEHVPAACHEAALGLKSEYILLVLQCISCHREVGGSVLCPVCHAPVRGMLGKWCMAIGVPQ